MATVIEAYRDDKGHLHLDPASAVIADIAAVLGRVGDEGGLTQGVAKLILERRAEIQQAFSDYEQLQTKTATLVDFADHPRIMAKTA